MSEINVKVVLPENQIDVTGKLGIADLRKILGDFFVLADAVYDIVTAKNVYGGLTRLVEVIGEYKDPSAAFGLAWMQFKDLDPTEAKAIYDGVVEMFDIEDDELEAKIEKVLMIPVVGFAEFTDAKGIIDKAATMNAELSGFAKVKALVELFSEEGLDQVWETYEFFLMTISTITALFEKKK